MYWQLGCIVDLPNFEVADAVSVLRVNLERVDGKDIINVDGLGSRHQGRHSRQIEV